MQGYGQVQLSLANDRIQERIDEASRARRFGRDERTSLRRSVGSAMIRVGQRLAAESPRAGSSDEPLGTDLRH